MKMQWLFIYFAISDSRQYISGLFLIQPEFSLKMCKWIGRGQDFTSIWKRKVYHTSGSGNFHEDEMEKNLVSFLDLSVLVFFILFCPNCIFVGTLWSINSLCCSIIEWFASKGIPIWLRLTKDLLVVRRYLKFKFDDS